VILLDTNVIIEYLKNRYPSLDPLLDTGECATCGIVLAELIHGIKSDSEKIKIVAALSEFHWISIDNSIWEKTGDNLRILRSNGITVPFQDAVIATLCIEKKCSLLTLDSHFKKIADLITDLVLYPAV